MVSDSTRWEQMKRVFERAVELPPGKREDWIGRECSDPEMREEVERLLMAHHKSEDGYLDPPADAASLCAMDTDVHETLVGGRIGQYRIERILSSGGMATVFEATQDQPRRRVALKMMKLGLTSRVSVRRLQFESEILARLEHPAIAHVYEAGTFRVEGRIPWDLPYFAMEFVEGSRDLVAYAQAEGSSVRRRLELFQSVCAGVQFGHQLGVLHLDLKPANILVTPTGQPKIIDFGIARSSESERRSTFQTQDGVILGTLQYMSPEQLSGRRDDVDTRADVYALGVVLYELLAGRLPYDLRRVRMHEAARIIEEDVPPPMSHSAPALGRDLDWIVAKALAKAREDRYASISEMSADIDRHLRNEPVHAGPPSRLYRLGKFVRRNKVPVSALVVVFVSLVTALVLTTRMYFELQQESAKADQVASFLGVVLRSPDPKAAGRDARIVDALLLACKDVDEMVTHPEANVELRNRLSTTLTDLGEYRAADELTMGAYEIALAKLPEGSHAGLSARNNVAGMWARRGEFDRAEAEFREALSLRIRHFGPEDPTTASSLGMLASFLGHVDKVEEAEEMHRRTIEAYDRYHDPYESDAINAKNNWSVFRYQQGRVPEARESFEALLADAREHLGPHDALTIKIMHNLASVLRRMGELSAAEKLMRETLAAKRVALGPTHDSTLKTLDGLGTLLTQRKDYEGAEAAHREAMQHYAATLGSQHVDTLGAKNNVATLVRLRGDVEGAKQIMQEVLATARVTLPEGHRKISAFQYGMALCQVELGELEEAETTLREALEAAGEGRDDRSPIVQDLLHAIVRLYERLGRPEAAEPYRPRIVTKPPG